MLRGSWAYLDESMIDVEPHVSANIRPEELEAGRRRIASLDRFTKDSQRALGEAVRSFLPDQADRALVRLKPPEERKIVARRTYTDASKPTLTVIADTLQELDPLFLYLIDAGDGHRDVTYQRVDGDYGLVESAP